MQLDTSPHKNGSMSYEVNRLIEALLWLADTGRDGAEALQIRLYNIGIPTARRVEEGLTWVNDALDGDVR